MKSCLDRSTQLVTKLTSLNTKAVVTRLTSTFPQIINRKNRQVTSTVESDSDVGVHSNILLRHLEALIVEQSVARLFIANTLELGGRTVRVEQLLDRIHLFLFNDQEGSTRVNNDLKITYYYHIHNNCNQLTLSVLRSEAEIPKDVLPILMSSSHTT